MTSRLWILWVGGLVLGLASPCPPPCSCPPAALSLACTGCPTDYLTVDTHTVSLAVSGCKDILYLLRLHRPLPPDKQGIKFALKKLQITDSFIDKIPESYVNDDYAIQSLVMSNNSIETLDAGLIAGNLTYLDLSQNRLSYINNRTFDRMNNIVFLGLGSNRIENMSVYAFSGLSKLVHLDLSRNNLTYLMDAIFLPLVSLQQLNLSSNRLEALSEKCFGSLLLLQQLDISYNQLTSVAPGTLQFLPNLAKLLLADNPQLRPDAQIFVGTGRRLQQVDASRTGLRRVPEALTHSVRYLSLAGNRISTLRCGDLDGYPLLHMLDFADNIIENVEDDALGRLEMISRLYLNRNKLRSVPKMLPDKLSYLSLDTNLIENLTLADFATLGSLKILLLSNNKITYIQENTFVQLISLEVLDVSNNPLKALTPNTFGGPVALKDFRIAFVAIAPPAKDISFPVPSPEGIESLHLQHSPGLTNELMADTAALAAMSRLQYLDMSFSNISNIRSDLLHFLPQLKILKLDGNFINCTEMNWLAEWMRDNLDDQLKLTKCFSPPTWAGRFIVDLPPVNETKYELTTLIPITYNITQPTPNLEYVRNIKQTMNVTSTTKILTNVNISGSNTLSNQIANKVDDKINATKKPIPSRVLISPESDLSISQLQRNDHIKSLLDFEHNEQHHMIFNIPKKSNTQKPQPLEKEKTFIPRLTISEKKIPKLLNADITNGDVTSDDKDNRSKKINKIISVKNPIIKLSGKSKLIEIFSQLSQRRNNSLHGNKQPKADPATQESVSLCIATGNLNGTENKTKCSQHPEIAPVPSENKENKNIKTERFIYRKNGNDKSSINAKPKKSKYVLRPNERFNATQTFGVKDTGANETAIKTRQLAYPTRVIESPDPLTPEHGNLYQHNLHGPTLLDTTSNDGTSAWKIAAPETKPVNLVVKTSDSSEAITNNRETKRNGTSINTKIKELYEKDKVIYESKFEEQGGENVSEFQTSRFRAEASGGQSGLGLGALVGVCGAACAALAGACLVRRRPRPLRRQRVPEMMEVQTITAVGELW